ncbi:MAG: NAD-dependent epimerase/dehydratase family protein [Flavobacteriaceae bacterium]
MVIGSGLLANTFSSFIDHDGVLIFASGVSNSTETNASEFEREKQLLQQTIADYPQHKIVYFSTASVIDDSVKHRPYVAHKLAMERLIATTAQTYLIARVSNVVGPHGNATNIMNFLIKAIRTQTPIHVWEYAQRNFIDKDDILYIITQLLQKNVSNTIVNVALENSVLVSDVVKQIERHFNTQAIATFVPKGNPLVIDVSDIKCELEVIRQQNGSGEVYISNLIRKYYK